MALPNKVRLVEVGPRDGLQNEKAMVPTDVKVELIDRLADAGLPAIEATSFVRPKWVPQMADARRGHGAASRASPACATRCWCRTCKGFEARAAPRAPTRWRSSPRRPRPFSSATSTARSPRASSASRPVVEAAQGRRHHACAATSRCVLGCPYEGEVAPDAVARVADALYDDRRYEISLGDTIGVGTPARRRRVLRACRRATFRSTALARPFPRHLRPGARQRLRRARGRRRHVRRSRRGPRRLPLRQGRDRQRRHRGRRLHARRPGHRDRRRHDEAARCRTYISDFLQRPAFARRARVGRQGGSGCWMGLSRWLREARASVPTGREP